MKARHRTRQKYMQLIHCKGDDDWALSFSTPQPKSTSFSDVEKELDCNYDNETNVYIIIDPEHIILQNMCIFAIVYCAVSLLFRLAQAIVLHCKFQDSQELNCG